MPKERELDQVELWIVEALKTGPKNRLELVNILATKDPEINENHVTNRVTRLIKEGIVSKEQILAGTHKRRPYTITDTLKGRRRRG